jgi:ATP-dependent Clp protease ATP-binding subunit ClpB
MEIITQHFRPEFINRIDDVVVFHPLAEAHIREIATLQIERLQQRLNALNLKLNVSEEVLQHLSEVGFDSVYGARPLKRAIQQLLENPLAQAILSGRFVSGNTISVNWENNAVTFRN